MCEELRESMNECHKCVGNNMSTQADNGMSTPEVCDELCNDGGDDRERKTTTGVG